MIISHENQFIFMHCRKTAGSTISAMLNNYLGANDIQIGAWEDTIEFGGEFNRRAAEETAKKLLRQPKLVLKITERYVTKGKMGIAPIVNNAMKNRYGYVLHAHSSAEQVKNFDNEAWRRYFKFCFVRNPFSHAVSDFYWRKGPQKGISFEEFLLRKADSERPDPEKMVPSHATNWPIYTINDQIVVDFVGHFETIDQDIKKLGQLLELDKPLSLPKQRAKGKSRKTSGVELYNDRTISLVEKIYKNELDHFNYSFDDFAALHVAS